MEDLGPGVSSTLISQQKWSSCESWEIFLRQLWQVLQHRQSIPAVTSPNLKLFRILFGNMRPREIGIRINHYKHPYSTTSIIWKVSFFPIVLSPSWQGHRGLLLGIYTEKRWEQPIGWVSWVYPRHTSRQMIILFELTGLSLKVEKLTLSGTGKEPILVNHRTILHVPFFNCVWRTCGSTCTLENSDLPPKRKTRPRLAPAASATNTWMVLFVLRLGNQGWVRYRSWHLRWSKLKMHEDNTETIHV